MEIFLLFLEDLKTPKGPNENNWSLNQTKTKIQIFTILLYVENERWLLFRNYESICQIAKSPQSESTPRRLTLWKPHNFTHICCYRIGGLWQQTLTAPRITPWLRRRSSFPCVQKWTTMESNFSWSRISLFNLNFLVRCFLFLFSFRFFFRENQCNVDR